MWFNVNVNEEGQVVWQNRNNGSINVTTGNVARLPAQPVKRNVQKRVECVAACGVNVNQPTNAQFNAVAGARRVRNPARQRRITAATTENRNSR